MTKINMTPEQAFDYICDHTTHNGVDVRTFIESLKIVRQALEAQAKDVDTKKLKCKIIEEQ